MLEVLSAYGLSHDLFVVCSFPFLIPFCLSDEMRRGCKPMCSCYPLNLSYIIYKTPKPSLVHKILALLCQLLN